MAGEKYLDVLEREREALLAESDALRRDLAAAREAFTLIQEELAVERDDNQAQRSSGPKTVRVQRDLYRRERDESRTALNAIVSQLNLHFDLVRQDYEQAEDHFKRFGELLLQAQSEIEAPPLVQLLGLLHDTLEDLTIDAFNEIVKTASNRQLSVSQWAGFTLFQIERVREIIARREYHKGLIIQAFAYSNWPPLICEQVFRMLRMSGEIKPGVLEKLTEEWIQQNLPEAPSGVKCFTTLRLGLESAHRRITGGLSRRDFGNANGYGETTLERYENWYKTIEEQAKRLPVDIVSYVESKLSQAEPQETTE
jgi:hypothetical protein